MPFIGLLNFQYAHDDRKGSPRADCERRHRYRHQGKLLRPGKPQRLTSEGIVGYGEAEFGSLDPTPPPRHNRYAMAAPSETRPASKDERLHLEPRIKLWVEKDGLLVLSDYRVQLLRHVAETGSLAEAAQRMGLSYRRAWGKIREIERNLGVTLVQSEVGGAGGGGSHLTRQGERLVALYQRFRRLMETDLGKEFQEVFDG